jgi:hypothetical protein
VTITNFSGTINRGDLLLVGKCAECHGDVARVIEGPYPTYDEPHSGRVMRRSSPAMKADTLDGL